MLLTENERKVLRFLAAHTTAHSINELAKSCKLTPNGAYKILKKFESAGVVMPKKIANIVSYMFNFSNEQTSRVLELAFIPEKNVGVYQDVKFGVQAGILSNKGAPHERMLYVIANDQKRKVVKRAQTTQTNDEIKQKLKAGDRSIVDAIENGVVLWGYDAIVRVVQECQ